MSKLTESKAKEVARKLCESYNPYKEHSERRTVEGSDMILYERYGILYTEQSIADTYIDTATKDILCGYRDRMSGYYDKWYRYSHSDNGRAYDEGVKLATQEPKCADEMRIIPCDN